MIKRRTGMGNGILRRWWRALNRDIPCFLHHPDGTTYFTNDEDRITEHQHILREYQEGPVPSPEEVAYFRSLHGLDIIDANDEIQDYVSRRGEWIEPELLKLLADLDHLIASRE